MILNYYPMVFLYEKNLKQLNFHDFLIFLERRHLPQSYISYQPARLHAEFDIWSSAREPLVGQ